MRIYNRLFTYGFLGSLGLIIGVPEVVAQQAEEIVVTARKKEENLQEVPIAIDVVPAEQITRQGIDSLRKLANISSSLQFTTGFSANDTQVVIRGLRPTRGRVNSAVLLDGVDISSESIGTYGGTLLIDPELYDLERIEVVKGPQNALYGRSAFAGAISYVTKKPTEEFETDVGIEVGNYDTYRATARLSGPIAPTLAASLNGMYHSQDGFYNNIPTGDSVGGSEGYALAGDLAWTPSDIFEARAKLSYSDDEYEVPPWRFYDPNFQYPFPQSAIDAGLVPDGFPDADQFGTATLAELLNQPGILDLEPGFVPGPRGFFPDGDQPGATMSADARTCTDPADSSTCRGYEDGTRDVLRAQINLDWDIGSTNLTSISHYADANVNTFQDGNANGSVFDVPFLSEIRYDTDTQLISQELRLSSNADSDSPLDWTVGLLYWNEQVDQIDTGNSCFAILNSLAPTTGGFPPIGLPPIPNTPCGQFQADIGPQGQFDSAREVWFRDTEHWSAYFLVSYDLIDSVTLDVEGRYVDERLEAGGPDFDTVVDPLGLGFNSDLFGATPDPDTGLLNGCVPWPPLAFPGSLSCVNIRPTGQVTGRKDDSYFVPKVTLTWRATENMLYYVYWAEAAKPAGIAVLTGGPGAFDPVGNTFEREEKTTYELGAKTDWFDGRLVANGAIFYDDYKKKQVSTQVVDPGSGLLVPRTANAGAAEVLGLEAELVWFATDHLDLRLNYTYLDTEYTDFVQRTGSLTTIAYGGNCTPFTDAGGRTVCDVSFSGNQLEFAPENALALAANYRRAMTSKLDWFIGADASYTDERYVAADNNLALEDYWIANLRLGLAAENWEVTGFVDNLFEDLTVKEGLDNIDSRYLAFGGGVLVPNGARYLLPAPRTYGIRANFRFGD
jgi:outer membrane receptor protein involved in Fe transport